MKDTFIYGIGLVLLGILLLMFNNPFIRKNRDSIGYLFGFISLVLGGFYLFTNILKTKSSYIIDFMKVYGIFPYREILYSIFFLALGTFSLWHTYKYPASEEDMSLLNFRGYALGFFCVGAAIFILIRYFFMPEWHPSDIKP